jgi:hypothetical protein
MKDYFMKPSSASTNQERDEQDNEARQALYSKSKEDEEHCSDVYKG